jgi:hypothetical protein
VDLHHEVLMLPHLLPASEMLARARPALAFGAPVLVAAPVDEVLHRTLHEMVHHRAYRDGVVSLRLLRDVAVRLPTLDGDAWAGLRARAARGRWLTQIAVAFRLIGEVFGAAALPAEAAALAARPGARAATLRVRAKAEGWLPPALDAAIGPVMGWLSGYAWRPGLDGPFALWRARRFARGVRLALGLRGGAAPLP